MSVALNENELKVMRVEFRELLEKNDFHVTYKLVRCSQNATKQYLILNMEIYGIFFYFQKLKETNKIPSNTKFYFLSPFSKNERREKKMDVGYMVWGTETH